MRSQASCNNWGDDDDDSVMEWNASSYIVEYDGNPDYCSSLNSSLFLYNL